MRILKVMKKGISKILKVLLRRLVIVGVVIVLQIAWLIWLAQVIGEHSKFIEWGLQLVSVAVVIYIVNKEENPAYKLAWTIPILIFPIFGGLLYLTLGNKKPAKKLRLELETAKAALRLYEALDDYDDALNVFSNFDVAEEILEQLG